MEPKHARDFIPEVLDIYKISAIPTSYKGCSFRSRIEARWAVFYDSLGLQWHYEPEGYNLSGICYLPDFWMPDLNCFIEIKGNTPNELDCEKSRRLAVASGKRVYVFFGGIVIPNGFDESPPLAYYFDGSGGEDCYYCWCQCPQCGSVGIEFDGRSDRLACKEAIDRPGCKRSNHGDKGYNFDTPKLRNAYANARGAKFGK